MPHRLCCGFVDGGKRPDHGRQRHSGGADCTDESRKGDEEYKSWRWLFIAGTVIGPLLVWLAGGKAIGIQPVASGWMLPAAGLLVGFGAALGSGCTSGHGICGLARLSFRSLVAVLSFMTSGLITIYLIRHLL